MACSYSPFCLGMCEFTDCPGYSTLDESSTHTAGPSASGSPTSLSAPPRFSEFMSDEQLSVLSKGLIPKNTAKSTKWALNTFEEWKIARNQQFPEDPVPDNVLECTNPSVLSIHLSRFSVEARKSNGEHYPPSSIHQLLSGILRHMRELNPLCPNFLDKKDGRFRQLHHTLDVEFHTLHAKGIGRKVKQSEVANYQRRRTEAVGKRYSRCKRSKGITECSVFYTRQDTVLERWDRTQSFEAVTIRAQEATRPLHL